ncbi:hypothetical protein EFK13_20660 [Bacillus cabrialesii]|uniref:hypothetical protein n=1 Tax=Bacillus cabrialesii TaxID=2487276 RepID=UPI001012C3CA|nr:hypothetical protein [Bacillus cabrialesii]UQE79061.1 hypothetical protein EFK13_20660 [Bacillus cabrialesii]
MFKKIVIGTLALGISLGVGGTFASPASAAESSVQEVKAQATKYISNYKVTYWGYSDVDDIPKYYNYSLDGYTGTLKLSHLEPRYDGGWTAFYYGYVSN